MGVKESIGTMLAVLGLFIVLASIQTFLKDFNNLPFWVGVIFTVAGAGIAKFR
ncbi:MAG: hypothetical protein KJ697_03575 [Nanoarchaeota archaeon]|nr:hypothetical protein [Nanoarchaeota archaeon]MBU4033126.1 hypothetical protein [Candidatus Thermoplasmatota archaeon]